LFYLSFHPYVLFLIPLFFNSSFFEKLKNKKFSIFQGRAFWFSLLNQNGGFVE